MRNRAGWKGKWKWAKDLHPGEWLEIKEKDISAHVKSRSRIWKQKGVEFVTLTFKENKTRLRIPAYELVWIVNEWGVLDGVERREPDDAELSRTLKRLLKRPVVSKEDLKRQLGED